VASGTKGLILMRRTAGEWVRSAQVERSHSWLVGRPGSSRGATAGEREEMDKTSQGATAGEWEERAQVGLMLRRHKAPQLANGTTISVTSSHTVPPPRRWCLCRTTRDPASTPTPRRASCQPSRRTPRSRVRAPAPRALTTFPNFLHVFLLFLLHPPSLFLRRPSRRDSAPSSTPTSQARVMPAI
jgi:hypothetical protein